MKFAVERLFKSGFILTLDEVYPRRKASGNSYADVFAPYLLSEIRRDLPARYSAIV